MHGKRMSKDLLLFLLVFCTHSTEPSQSSQSEPACYKYPKTDETKICRIGKSYGLSQKTGMEIGFYLVTQKVNYSEALGLCQKAFDSYEPQKFPAKVPKTKLGLTLIKYDSFIGDNFLVDEEEEKTLETITLPESMWTGISDDILASGVSGYEQVCLYPPTDKPPGTCPENTPTVSVKVDQGIVMRRDSKDQLLAAANKTEEYGVLCQGEEMRRDSR